MLINYHDSGRFSLEGRHGLTDTDFLGTARTHVS
jgi:hypothetical protein